MSQGHTITITPSVAHVEVRLDGELLASTDHPVLLDETGLPTRYYIDGKTHDGVVWAYETPIPTATDITGLLSFYPDRAEITVDGELVKA
jgi:uncharacterized protein (DUF427 family)